MITKRILIGVATLTFSLVAVEVRAITLPDTTSPCSTGSVDGCLKIKNSDSSHFGAPAIVAITQSQFGTAISANGTYDGLDTYGGNIGVNSSGGSMGVYGSGPYAGIYGSTSNASGYGVYGQNTATGGASVGVYGSGTNTGVVGAGAVGVKGSGSLYGVYGAGSGTGSFGVFAVGDSYGVWGFAPGSGVAVYGDNSSSVGWAGYFNGRVYASGAYTSSDARLKKDVAGLSYGLKDLEALRPITFKWKDQSRGNGRNIGFLAQDLQKVVPELVDQDSKSGMLSVNYPGLVPVLVKAIQEQQVTIQRQEARIEGLEQRPMVSSMFSGGINVLVAIGGLTALLLTVMRRRREQAQR